jgi:hypothetical protein
MIPRLLVVVGLVLFLTGCGKNTRPVASPDPVSTREQTAAETVNRPTPSPAPPAEVNAGDDETGDEAALLTPLTQALRRYCFEHQGAPRNFQEFADAGLVRIPPAPAGKKFAIETKRMEVILVKR